LNLTERKHEIFDIGRPPKSCEDLYEMGHTINGFFLVKGKKMIELLYCNLFSNKKGTTYFNFISYCSSESFRLQTKKNGLGMPT
jgi:hypothetical protein